jgi:hypothetical protein
MNWGNKEQGVPQSFAFQTPPLVPGQQRKAAALQIIAALPGFKNSRKGEFNV